jgi:hypothetical protein
MYPPPHMTWTERKRVCTRACSLSHTHTLNHTHTPNHIHTHTHTHLSRSTITPTRWCGRKAFRQPAYARLSPYEEEDTCHWGGGYILNVRFVAWRRWDSPRTPAFLLWRCPTVSKETYYSVKRDLLYADFWGLPLCIIQPREKLKHHEKLPPSCSVIHCLHTHTHTQNTERERQTDTQTQTQTHTHIHTDTHIYIYTHTHIHTS